MHHLQKDRIQSSEYFCRKQIIEAKFIRSKTELKYTSARKDKYYKKESKLIYEFNIIKFNKSFLSLVYPDQ